MALNFGMTKLMITLITASSTATAMPVANVHSKPLFAILHTAHTAMIGALISIIRPMVTNIWICVMSFVERVMSDAVEKRFISDITHFTARRFHELRDVGHVIR